jgi:hypothetical protein
MTPTQIISTIILVAMVILTFVIIIMSLLRFLRVNYLLKEGAKAIGTVIDEIKAVGGNRYKEIHSYFPVVRFYTGDGRLIISKSLISRRGENGKSPWEIGDKVEIRYNIKNPVKIIVHDCYYGKADNPKKMLIPFLVSIIMFGIAIYFIFQNIFFL